MTVLTVYLCGTGSNSFDNINPTFWQGELVATLAQNNQGREFAQWFIVDGPGSGNLQEDDLWVESPNYSDIKGSLFGSGWEENVNHALCLMKGNFDWQREKLTEEQYNQLKKAGIPIEDVKVTGSFLWRKYDYGDRHVTQQQLQQQIIRIFRKDGIIPTQVNLVGWSRGGITCHMLANAMLADPQLKDIPVNIFAIDPVPGPLNFQPEKVTLGKNVKEYVGFYAKDERSKGFTCVIPMVTSDTKMHIFPISGRHATLVGNASIDGSEGENALYAPSLIVRHFAEVCLTRWGCDLANKLALTDTQITSYHTDIVNNADKYIAMRRKTYSIHESTGNDERKVSLGKEGKAFSDIQGEQYKPTTGLISDYLSNQQLYDVIK
ncbi:MAG TPA: hypothetical protein DIS95_09960 [Proteus vulgaris]|uniref:Uncharacterized protein n=1 Tax=Proteus vulgaris TaxID=585 RepID=A0A379FCH1_PROVU|nr:MULTISPECIES: hypothetical protein [Proteus]NBN45793.1 hypothetical protein [Proteus sp. G2626]UBH60631.1 hypothetical protein LA322_10900 [Proteus vulgaris]UWU01599.1 hypothetical protein N1711_06815 [Proteus vulgaris]SUC17306.1 Uncharacterised protein [Proteus vulgaris]VTP85080.1 Uncharacterised protein [Proteus vulgaris]